MKGHLTDFHGPGGDLRGNRRPQDKTMYGQMCGNFMSYAGKRKRNTDGLSRNRSSIMPDTYVVSSSLNQKMKNLNTL